MRQMGLIVVLLSFFLPSLVFSQAGNLKKQASISALTLGELRKETLKLSNKSSEQKLIFHPVNFSNGTEIVFIAPAKYRSLVKLLNKKSKYIHKSFEELFGKLPAIKTQVRIMKESDFLIFTGAPAWTNAMYFRGEIIIPIPNEKKIDYPNIFRSLRHEYSHAVTHSLSKGKCPGWLDEGIAQLVEGVINPALEPALHQWLDQHSPLKLSALKGGFTRLDSSMVPAAYAQSLFASKTLIESYGFSKIRKYFNNLKSEPNEALAFIKSFQISSESFENILGSRLEQWHYNKNTTFVSPIQYTRAKP